MDGKLEAPGIDWRKAYQAGMDAIRTTGTGV